MKWRIVTVSRSLLIRILLVETLTLFGACIILPLITLSELRSSAETIQNEVLRSQAVAIVHGLSYSARSGWQEQLNENLKPIFATGYDGRAYAVVDVAQTAVITSRYALPRQWPASVYKPYPQKFAADSLSGFSLPAVIAGHHAWIVVTQDQAGPGAVVDDVMRAFLSRYILALVALLVAMQVMNGLLLWHAFRKLRSVARSAARIGPRSLNTRLTESGMPAEILPLVHAINGLLDRVQMAFHQQEEFAGNVAHELKTPLATLRIQAEEIKDPVVRTVMSGQIGRMAHAITQLRDLAGLERAGEAQMVLLDLHGLVVELVADMAPLILDSGHTIAVTGGAGDIPMRGNTGLLGIAISNLINNALAHTPPGCHVEIGLLPSGGLTISDDGPGIVEDQAPRLPRRFHRADHVRSDGAGLGLSIVQRIVDAHHARFEVGRSISGGAEFSIHFPLVQSDTAITPRL